jgi:hypothetical protein
MSSRIRQYLFGSIFFAIGIYYCVQKNFLEATLYIMAGLSFVSNTLVNEPFLAAYKKVMVIVTWSLIIVTGIFFLWVLQSKYF